MKIYFDCENISTELQAKLESAGFVVFTRKHHFPSEGIAVFFGRTVYNLTDDRNLDNVVTDIIRDWAPKRKLDAWEVSCLLGGKPNEELRRLGLQMADGVRTPKGSLLVEKILEATL